MKNWRENKLKVTLSYISKAHSLTWFRTLPSAGQRLTEDAAKVRQHQSEVPPSLYNVDVAITWPITNLPSRTGFCENSPEKIAALRTMSSEGRGSQLLRPNARRSNYSLGWPRSFKLIKFCGRVWIDVTALTLWRRVRSGVENLHGKLDRTLPLPLTLHPR